MNFEASGALLQASLVMRDRETDSWWSIMTSNAIGGELKGSDLVELPYGEKMTWGEWVERHPDTKILSVDGIEHEAINPYDRYFSSDGTFRGLRIDDQRLPPKESIFSFWLSDKPYAAAHRSFEQGHLFEVDGGGVLLYRPKDASIFASSEALWVDAKLLKTDRDIDRLRRRAAEQGSGVERLSGFDTYWYSWVAVNKNSRLLQ